jgi:hypothetical protein
MSTELIDIEWSYGIIPLKIENGGYHDFKTISKRI